MRKSNNVAVLALRAVQVQRGLLEMQCSALLKRNVLFDDSLELLRQTFTTSFGLMQSARRDESWEATQLSMKIKEQGEIIEALINEFQKNGKT